MEASLSIFNGKEKLGRGTFKIFSFTVGLLRIVLIRSKSKDY